MGAWDPTHAEFYDALANEIYTPLLRRFLFKRRRPQDPALDVEDLIQDALARAIEHFPTYRRGTNFEGWILSVADSVAQNRFKHWLCTDGKARPLEGMDVAQRTAVLRRRNPPGHALTEGFGDKLARALRRAQEERPAFLDALLLHEAEGYSVAEVAQRLGIPDRTAMSRIGRAKERVRTFMIEDEMRAGGTASQARERIMQEYGLQRGRVYLTPKSLRRETPPNVLDESGRYAPMLIAALGDLKPDLRRIVELCDIQGRSYDDAAIEMEMLPITATKKHRAARQRVIRQLSRTIGKSITRGDYYAITGHLQTYG